MSRSNIPYSIFLPDNKKQPQSFLANSKGIFGSIEAVTGEGKEDIESLRQEQNRIKKHVQDKHNREKMVHTQNHKTHIDRKDGTKPDTKNA